MLLLCYIFLFSRIFVGSPTRTKTSISHENITRQKTIKHGEKPCGILNLSCKRYKCERYMWQNDCKVLFKITFCHIRNYQFFLSIVLCQERIQLCDAIWIREKDIQNTILAPDTLLRHWLSLCSDNCLLSSIPLKVKHF